MYVFTTIFVLIGISVLGGIAFTIIFDRLFSLYEEISEQMNLCSGDFPSDINEIEESGLTEVPSVKISVPRIKESPVHFECKFSQSLRLGSRHRMTIGEVVYIHLREDIIDLEHMYIKINNLQPVARLSGPQYAHINDIFEMKRPYFKEDAIKRGEFK